jgi:hypothetical protein
MAGFRSILFSVRLRFYLVATLLSAGTVWRFFKYEHPTALMYVAAAAATAVAIATGDFWLNCARYARANHTEAKSRRRQAETAARTARN